MSIDTKTSDSPGWWLHKAARKLEARLPRLQALQDRFEGNPPLPVASESVKEAYRAFQRKSRTNFAELIVEAPRERMQVHGFVTAASDDVEGDEEARRIWDENGLDVESADVHEHMLAMGDGYSIVGPPEEDDGVPIITGEDPRQVVTIHDPVRQRRIRAALKMFHDHDEQVDLAYLYLPGELHVAYREVRRNASNLRVRFSPSTWNWDDDRSAELPDGLMPVVRFRNRRGVGEFEHHVDVLDRINYMVLQRLVIATFQAFRQRAIKGLPDRDDAGREIDYTDVFSSEPGALWQVPEGVDFWESATADMTGILAAAKDDIRDLSAVTRTPFPMLSPDAANQAAEGASFTREGLVFKTEDRIKRATEGWKDVMATAFRWLDDEARADRSKLKVIWGSPERLSLAERADASTKAQDVPWRHRMEHIWGFHPSEINEMDAARAQDALLAGLAAAASGEAGTV